MSEATLAFDLNTGIFDALETLASDSKEGEGVIGTLPKDSKYNPERTYALMSVAAFITAGSYIKYQTCGSSKSVTNYERLQLSLFSPFDPCVWRIRQR